MNHLIQIAYIFTFFSKQVSATSQSLFGSSSLLQLYRDNDMGLASRRSTAINENSNRHTILHRKRRQAQLDANNSENPDPYNCNHFRKKRCNQGNCMLKDADPKHENDAEAFFTESDFGVTWFCLCDPGYDQSNLPSTPEEPYCNHVVNICSEKGAGPCKNGGKCINTGPGVFKCSCNKFWRGQLCHVDVNECSACEADAKACPCKNDGRCVNVDHDMNKNGFICECRSGVSGDYCEKVSNPCERNPCVEAHVHDPETCCKAVQKLSLTDPKTLLGYKCYCKDRWGGPNCDMQAGDCTTDKCGTNGICVEDENYEGYYKCMCNQGFKSSEVQLATSPTKWCTEVLDSCISNPCKNKGSCLNLGANAIKCVCVPGYTGPFCETLGNPCDTSIGQPPKCRNGGKCEIKSDSRGTAYECYCGTDETARFTGKYCEIDVDECKRKNDFCPQQFTEPPQCINFFGGWKCICKQGYEGIRCNEITSACKNPHNPCLLDSECNCDPNSSPVPCLPEEGKNFVCHCPNFFKDDSNQCDNLKSTDVLLYSPLANSYSIQFPNGRKSTWNNNFAEIPGAWFNPAGGLRNDPYLHIQQGILYQQIEEAIAGDFSIILFFKPSGPIMGSILTWYDDHNGGPALSIKGDYEGLCTVVTVYNTDIIFYRKMPCHSMGRWHTIAVTYKSSNGLNTYFNGNTVGEPFRDLKGIVKDTSTGLPTDWNGLPRGTILVGKEDLHTPGLTFNGGVTQLQIYKSEMDMLQIREIAKWRASSSCPDYVEYNFPENNVYRDNSCHLMDGIPIETVTPVIFSECELSAANGRLGVTQKVNVTFADFSQGAMVVPDFGDYLRIQEQATDRRDYIIFIWFKAVRKPAAYEPFLRNGAVADTPENSPKYNFEMGLSAKDLGSPPKRIIVLEIHVKFSKESLTFNVELGEELEWETMHRVAINYDSNVVGRKKPVLKIWVDAFSESKPTATFAEELGQFTHKYPLTIKKSNIAIARLIIKNDKNDLGTLLSDWFTNIKKTPLKVD